MRIELRQSLGSYQDCHMFLLALAGLASSGAAAERRRSSSANKEGKLLFHHLKLL